jgi:hypothetical protein
MRIGMKWGFITACAGLGLVYGVFPGQTLHAQTSTAELDITVLDPTDAIIPGAQVKIVGAETGNLLRTLHTSDKGVAIAPLLPPQTYDLTISAPGFSNLTRKGMVLRVGETVTLRVKLETGSINQSVTVVGVTPLVEESSTTLASVMEAKGIQQLPLNGRSYLELARLVPGAVPNGTSRDNSFSAYGNSGLQNAFLLDGARNVSYLRGLDTQQRDTLRPPLDSVAEFSVQMSNFSAEFGASAGAIVSAVTKGGTNTVHGSAYDFLRNDNLDAVNYFAASGTKPLLVQNQYGGSLGGPVARDHAWLFGAFEGTHIRGENAAVATVPLVSMVAGNFGSTPVYDPLSTAPNSNGSGSVRQQFPNNTIPTNRFSPIGQQLASRYPAPNLTGTSGNFAQNTPTLSSNYNGVVRGDVQVSAKDSMFGRYSVSRFTSLGQPNVPPPAQTPVEQTVDTYGLGYGYTRTFGPTFVNEFRFAWSRVTLTQDATMKKDEIIPGLLDPRVDSGIPVFNVTGYAGIGIQALTNNVPLLKISADWDVSENASKSIGKHLIKFGADFQLIRPTTAATMAGRGTMGFTGVFSQNPQHRAGTGSGVADLLLGDANDVTTGTAFNFVERGKYLGLFLQDRWALTPSFNLTLGLRYELMYPYTETNNQAANLILDRGDPLYGQMILAGDSRRSNSLLYMDKNNWAPRIGFAWNVPHTHGLVIRSAYGIFYAQDTGLGSVARLNGNPPFYGYGSQSIISDQLNPTTGFVLSQGAAIPRPAPINPKDFVLRPTATSQLVSWYQRYTTPYTQEWNFDVQKQLTGELLAEVTYVGNHGVAFWGVSQGNQPLTNGPGSPNTRRPLAQYTVAPIQALAPWGQSIYHGVSGKLERRFSHGLSFLSSLSFGKSIDLQNIAINVGGTAADNVQNSYDLRSQRGPSDTSVPLRWVSSGVWDLPLGTGRALLHEGWLGRVAGPWQITVIYALQSGMPFTPTLNFDNANSGTTNRPDRICAGTLANPTIMEWFDLSCFAAAPQYHFGNSGKNFLRGPRRNNLDLGIHRLFVLPLEKRTTLDFRLEAFNADNHPEFGNPGQTIGNPGAGKITGTAVDNREVQLALRLEF